MDDKTEAFKRETLMYICQAYGHLDKRTVVKKVKDKGVYRNYVGDDEVYELIRKFADYHNLPFGETPVEHEPEYIAVPNKKVIIVEEPHPHDDDPFYASLQLEHSRLSKKILQLNKLMELYKADKNEETI